jgi:hypothetical protein
MLNLLRSVFTGALGALALAGCSASVRVAFHPTDISFTPTPRDSEPNVYLARNEVPQVTLRSVGIIEITAPLSEASKAAAAKGKELGCWALIEHSVFDRMQSGSQMPRETRSSRPAEANVLVAHGGIDHVRGDPTRRAKHSLVTQFDCVMNEDKQTPAAPIVM